MFATKAYIDNRKIVNSNTSSTCPHNVENFGPLMAEIGSAVCGTPVNFNGFRVLPSLLQRRCSTEANQTVHDVWPSPRLLHYVFIFCTLYIQSAARAPKNVKLYSVPGTKFTLHPSLAFSYIGSVTALRFSSDRKPNFEAWYKEWNYGTFAEGAACIRLGGHHVGHRPTL